MVSVMSMRFLDNHDTFCMMFAVMVLATALAAEDATEEGPDPGAGVALDVAAHGEDDSHKTKV